MLLLLGQLLGLAATDIVNEWLLQLLVGREDLLAHLLPLLLPWSIEALFLLLLTQGSL